MKKLKFLLCAALVSMSGAAMAESLYHPYNYTDQNGNAKVGCGSTILVEHHEYYPNGVIYDGESTLANGVTLYCSNGTIYFDGYDVMLWAT